MHSPHTMIGSSTQREYRPADEQQETDSVSSCKPEAKKTPASSASHSKKKPAPPVKKAKR